MASKHLPSVKDKLLEHVIARVGTYPQEAYEFVQQGLCYTVHRAYGGGKPPTVSQHVSGPQLCQGLREYANAQWGLLARAVLRRWNITSTLDFGLIVFAMIDAGQLRKTADDTLEDFRNVFDFPTAFDSSRYRIGVEALGD